MFSTFEVAAIRPIIIIYNPEWKGTKILLDGAS